MRGTESDGAEVADDEALHALYEASARIRPWDVALRATNAVIGASHSTLLTADARTKRTLAVQLSDPIAATDLADPSALGRYLEPLWSRPVAEVFYDERISGPAVDGASKVTSVIAGKVREYRRHVSFVMFERSNARAFTAGELLRAKRCVRHLATAMKVTQHCEDMKTDAAVGHRLLHGSSRPMLLLGRDREILACNPAGRALLAQGNVIHADGGVLKCRLPDNETALSKLLERFVNPARPKSERRNRAAVKLRDANGAAILCSVANMASDENAVTPPVDVVALLSFASLHVPETQTDPEILASLYGFSKAELRLVSALLRGENLFQIAARNCVTLATVRSQLRSVFAKTNTHRQAEVIQLLLVALLL